MDVSFYEFSTMNAPDSWGLKILRDAQGNEGERYGWGDLTWGRRVEIAPPLEIAVERLGVKRDVSFAEGMIPVVSSRAASTLRSVAGDEVELIPARIEGESDQYFVLNVLSVVKCLDEEKTQYLRKWTKDSIRPDRAGDYRTLIGIAIDPALAGGHNLFRLGGSLIEIIASGAVKESFEREGLTGASFREACKRRHS